MNNGYALLTPAEVRERFRISISTLYRWKKKGFIKPVIQQGQVVRYSEKDIVALIERAPDARD